VRRLLLALPAAALLGLELAGTRPLLLTVPLGLLAALLAPGAALLGLVAPDRLRQPAALALVPATSTGVLVLLGLVLDLLPAGQTRNAWMVGLLVVTAAAAASARGEGAGLLVGWPGPGALVRAATCVGLLVGAVAVATSSQSALQARQPMTQLWITPEGGVPTVHLRNDEGRPTTYVVRVAVGSAPAVDRQVSLPSGQAWTSAVPARRTGSDLERVVVTVYVDGSDQAYRSVVLNDGQPSG